MVTALHLEYLEFNLPLFCLQCRARLLLFQFLNTKWFASEEDTMPKVRSQITKTCMEFEIPKSEQLQSILFARSICDRTNIYACTLTSDLSESKR
mmetsp:Transcript_19978/g.29764  ORF Transcript_19978/g.29764 Transcript_19978/m.29764 type:complete len:95 (-) Transcript_19978:922-1206(-)